MAWEALLSEHKDFIRKHEVSDRLLAAVAHNDKEQIVRIIKEGDPLSTSEINRIMRRENGESK